MRIAPLVAAGTLILGLACGTAELTDGRRMPVVKIEALVTSTCSRPWGDWPPHTDDTAADTVDTGCLPEEEDWGHCGGDDDDGVRIYEDPDKEKVFVGADRETVDRWDGVAWLSRSAYGRLPEPAGAERAIGIQGEAWIRGVWTGTLYELRADGTYDIFRPDLLVAEVGDQLVFAYPVRGFDIVETHQIGWVDERLVEPNGREGPGCCCVSGPGRGATGGFLLAFLLATLRRQPTRAKPTT